MKFSKDLGFAVVFRNKKIGNEILKAILESFRVNKKIFGSAPKKFNVFVCDTEEEFKKHAKYWYHEKATATVLLDNTLVTRSPEFIGKKGLFKRKQFQDIINHEMNHAFLGKYYTGSSPVWLIEGLACYVGKFPEIPEIKKLDYSILEYRYIKKRFRKNKFLKHGFWRGFVEYIDKKYSIKKLIILMKEYGKNPVKKNYEELFLKIFKKTEKELFREFVEDGLK